MDRRIMLGLAIAASLLNAGFSVNAAGFRVKREVISVEVQNQCLKKNRSPKKEEVDPATVEKLRIALEEAKKVLAKAEYKRDTINRIKKYGVYLINGLLVSGGIVAPLYRISSDVYNFLASKDINIEECVLTVGLGIFIQANSVILMDLTGRLSRFIDNYTWEEYSNASTAEWNAEREYNNAIHKNNVII